MTGNLPVTVVATSSLDELLNPVPGQRMEMPGFDPEFVDFPDYIIRITDRIWHERKVDLCLDYYSEDCLIHTLGGDISGAQTVVDNTHATMKAFPDRRLEADNVIWSDEGEGKFYSSHLITSIMTNEGDSEFGPATGKRVRVLTIADCLCRENRIIEEWLVRDNGGLALQLGFDLDEIAKRRAEQGPSLIEWHDSARRELVAADHVFAEFPASPEDNRLAFAEAVFGQIWSGKTLGLVAKYYDFRAAGYFPNDRQFYGPSDFSDFFSQIFEAIPDAKLRVEHVADVPYLGDAWDISVRWSLAGTHTGTGIYGPESGALIYIIGVTQWRVINGQIHSDWTVWDDLAVRRQIEEYRLSR